MQLSITEAEFGTIGVELDNNRVDDDGMPRHNFTITITDASGATLTTPTDVVSQPAYDNRVPDPVDALSAALTFAASDGERYHYRRTYGADDGDGYVYNERVGEWYYLNDTLLDEARAFMDDDADDEPLLPLSDRLYGLND